MKLCIKRVFPRVMFFLCGWVYRFSMNLKFKPYFSSCIIYKTRRKPEPHSSLASFLYLPLIYHPPEDHLQILSKFSVASHTSLRMINHCHLTIWPPSFLQRPSFTHSGLSMTSSMESSSTRLKLYGCIHRIAAQNSNEFGEFLQECFSKYGTK